MAEIVTIRSARLTAEVNTRGAELHALRDESGRDLQWDGDPTVWNGRAPILFPVIGLVNDGLIHVDGKPYPMPKHGFARHRTFAMVAQDETWVTFRLEDDAETRVCYPFAFRLDIRFAIDDDALTVTAHLDNHNDVVMPASFGFHPALRWPLPWGGDKEEHRVRFDEAEPGPIRRIDRAGLLTPVEHPTPVEGHDLALDSALFDDDAIMFMALRSRGLFYGVPGYRNLRVDFPDMPQLGLWQKPGADYICIEPWAGINDPEGYTGELANKPGIVLLPPRGSHQFLMRIATNVPMPRH